MKKKRHWFLKYPLVPAAVLPLLGILFISIMAVFIALFIKAIIPPFALQENTATNISEFISRCIFIILAVFAMKKSSGGTFRFGFGKENLKQSILLSLFGLVHIVETFIEGCLFSEGIRSDVDSILSAILLGLGAGLFEETICRGVVLSNMMYKWREKKQSILLAVLLSGIAFGLLHLLSLAENSVPWVLMQIFVAGGLGIFFGAVYVRTHNIWGPIILHSLMDTVYFLFIFSPEITAKDYVMNIVVAVFFTLVGLYLIRPAKHSEIKALWFG